MIRALIFALLLSGCTRSLVIECKGDGPTVCRFDSRGAVDA